jgi:hypothetical protein
MHLGLPACRLKNSFAGSMRQMRKNFIKYSIKYSIESGEMG